MQHIRQEPQTKTDAQKNDLIKVVLKKKEDTASWSKLTQADQEPSTAFFGFFSGQRVQEVRGDEGAGFWGLFT